MTKPDTTATTALREVEQKHSAALQSDSAQERKTALTLAQTALDHAAEREARRLRRDLADAEQARVDAHARVVATADSARRARACALLERVFASAPDALPALLAAFRTEPSRKLATAIRTAWAALGATAATELGSPLSNQTLGALLADDILKQPTLAGAVNKFAEPDFGSGDAVLAALDRVTAAGSAAEVQAALETAELALMATASRYSGTAPDPGCAERHALRQANATDGDLASARAELADRQKRERTAAFQRSYEPPPSLAQFLSERLGLGA